MKKLVFGVCILSLALVACAKKSEHTDTQASASQETAQPSSEVSAVDKPVLDEKNTDVIASEAKAP